MKAISFNFEIHQPMRLKRYRFFDIGNDHYYYDDFLNDDIITSLAEHAYLPAARTLLGISPTRNTPSNVPSPSRASPSSSSNSMSPK